MTYDFNILFQEYLDDPFTQRSGIPTLQGFVNTIYDEIEYHIENGTDPDPRGAYLYEYITKQEDEDPDWIENYAP